MSDKSGIEWTDATWNPVRGCSIVSKGCTNCYAMRLAHRFTTGAYKGLTKLTRGGPVWTGAIKLVPDQLEQPLAWKRPRRIFVNSMSDLFHEDVPFDYIDQVFAVMALADRHVFQVLTKRPERMLEYFKGQPLMAAAQHVEARVGRQATATARARGEDVDAPNWDMWWDWPLRNVWLGASVEDQAAANERIPLLLQVPAAVRWISAEPLLGPVDIFSTATGDLLHYSGDPREPGSIDWIVAGGESGPGARPMHPAWIRSLRDQCAAAHDGVPFFFKQWGAWRMAYGGTDGRRCAVARDNGTHVELEVGRVLSPFEAFDGYMATMQHLGKKDAGRQLDGRLHDEYPTEVK